MDAFRCIDSNRDRKITFDEFCQAQSHRKHLTDPLSEPVQVAQFKLGQALGTTGLKGKIGDADVKRTERVLLSNAFAEADVDGDGEWTGSRHL